MGSPGAAALLECHVIVLVVCLLIPSEAILTKSMYYLRCRDYAEYRGNNHLYTELPTVMKLLLHGTYRRKILHYSDIDPTYIRPEIATVIGDSECPSTLAVTEGPVYECPSYTVLEFDPLRRPHTLTQVKCRCLSCQGPWRDEAKLDICTPLFQFVNVLRVVGIRQNGTRVFAQVWEPVSYDCICDKLRLGRFRFVMAH